MSAEKSLRIGQGVCFVVGGLLAILSLKTARVLGGIPTAEVGLGSFTLGFIAAAGAEYATGELRRASLLVLAALAFVVTIVEPYDRGIAGAVALFLIGIGLLGSSVDTERVREQLPV